MQENVTEKKGAWKREEGTPLSCCEVPIPAEAQSHHPSLIYVYCRQRFIVTEDTSCRFQFCGVHGHCLVIVSRVPGNACVCHSPNVYFQGQEPARD